MTSVWRKRVTLPVPQVLRYGWHLPLIVFLSCFFRYILRHGGSLFYFLLIQPITVPSLGDYVPRFLVVLNSVILLCSRYTAPYDWIYGSIRLLLCDKTIWFAHVGIASEVPSHSPEWRIVGGANGDTTHTVASVLTET